MSQKRIEIIGGTITVDDYGIKNDAVSIRVRKPYQKTIEFFLTSEQKEQLINELIQDKS